MHSNNSLDVLEKEFVEILFHNTKCESQELLIILQDFKEPCPYYPGHIVQATRTLQILSCRAVFSVDDGLEFCHCSFRPRQPHIPVFCYFKFSFDTVQQPSPTIFRSIVRQHWGVSSVRLVVVIFTFSFGNNISSVIVTLSSSVFFLVLVFQHLALRPFVSIHELGVVIQQVSQVHIWMVGLVV